MKYILMCEGKNELTVLNLLLGHDKLIITPNELLGLVPYQARQLDKSPQILGMMNIYTEDVIIYRIGDKMTDELRIPKQIKKRVIREEKYCTLPELEILLIISEEKYNEYIKQKSKITPKKFAKMYIKCNRMRYDNSSLFYEKYYQDIDKLVQAIQQYSVLHKTHKKDEHYLIELLK